MRRSEEEVRQYLEENPGESAYGLLLDTDKTLEAGFRKVDRALIDFMKKVRKYFPDATYYTASGGFNLMLGESHRGDGIAQQELLALSGRARISDGDF